MDEPTVKWSRERFDDIKTRLDKFLTKEASFKGKNITYVPISALTGANINEPAKESGASWYSGPTLFQAMDSSKVPGRDETAALRMPVIDRYSDRGVVCLGKVEVGVVFEGMPVMIMPTRTKAKVEKIWLDDDTEVFRARPGEGVRVRLKGVEEVDVHKGFVICDPEAYCPAVTRMQAQLSIQDVGDRGIITAGYTSMIHLHTADEEATIEKLLTEVDRKTGATKTNPRFVKAKSMCTVVISVPKSIACEKYDAVPQLGRFTLRNEGRTIAIGKISGLPKPKTKA
jgi:peptide chain release factor subunit 3